MRREVLGLAAIAVFASSPLLAGNSAQLSSERGNQLAQSQTGGSSGKTKEDVHAPTNRVGESVPNMKAEPKADTQQSGSSTHKKDETEHAPTNRMGEAVPDMKSDKTK